MDRIYALGVNCIEFVQEWCEGYEGYFKLVNDISNPHHVFEYLFPLLSIVDSVFGAQLVLCMAFGGWLNAVMKWWLLEDRPYWWVEETSFYSTGRKPHIKQYSQTCETGPGCPSGHSTTIGMLCILIVMWISLVMHERRLNVWWWKSVVYPLLGSLLGATMLARVFVAAHFPHQCFLGAFVGLFLAPALCIYVCDPYVWRCGAYATYPVRTAVAWHVVSALLTVAIAHLTYFSLTLCDLDPQWTVKLASRWCENPSHVSVSTTPVFALAQCTGALLGWALAVTPSIARYRHYTKNRSLLISLFATGICAYVLKNTEENMSKDNALLLYALNFIISAIKPIIYLRVCPALAMWPFTETPSQDKKIA